MSNKAVALPLDVLRDVLEYSARIDKQVALNLALVSSWVREWIDPVLYGSVKLLRRPTTRLFLRTLESSKSPDFYQTHVKSVSFSVDVHCQIDHAIKILKICGGLVHLSIYFVPAEHLPVPTLATCYTSGAFESVMSGISPKNFTVYFPTTIHLFYPNFRLPLYTSLTHLTVLNDWVDWTTWRGFELLTSLSHLSVDVRAHSEPIDPRRASKVSRAVEYILDHCCNLQVFVILFIFVVDPLPTRDAIVSCMIHDDRRLVFLCDTEPFRDRDASEEGPLWRMGEFIVGLQGNVGRVCTIGNPSEEQSSFGDCCRNGECITDLKKANLDNTVNFCMTTLTSVIHPEEH